MKKRGDVFKCNICGNVIEVLHAAAGPLVCCGKPMEQMTEKTADSKRKNMFQLLLKAKVV